MNFDEFISAHGNCLNWLEFNTLIKSIPPEFRLNLTGSDWVSEYAVDWRIDLPGVCSKKPVRHLYHILRQLNVEKTVYKVKERIEKVLGTQLTWKDYRAMFSQIYRITTITKYRDFQYHFLLQKIPCNRYLYYCKIKDTDQCDYCEASQDMKHLFWECEQTQAIWAKLWQFLGKYNIFGSYSYPTVLRCDVVPGKHIANLIVLITKQIIYRYKCKSEKIKWTHVATEILYIKKLEKYNASITGTLVKHQKKWGILDPLCFEDG